MKDHTVRCADGGLKTFTNYVSKVKAIKMMCTECCGWDSNPSGCTDVHCPLYPFRGRTLCTMHSDTGDEEEE